MKVKVIFELIKRDYISKFNEQPTYMKLLKKYIISIPFRVTVRYRAQSFFWNNSNKYFKIISVLIKNGNIKKYGVEFGLNSQIGAGLNIHHVNGIVIGEGAIIGENFNLFHQVTIGQKKGKYPCIGKDVFIYPGAKIVGDIEIGDNVIIGTNAIIDCSVQSNNIAYGYFKPKTEI